MKPRTNQRDAARVALLPLDCPPAVLTRFFSGEPRATLSRHHGFEQYMKAAHRQLNIKPTQPAGVEQIREVASFAALTALRTHWADPFAGTDYENREPDGSAEARMLRNPLQKHPGLTRFSLRARRYYVATITWLFENEFPPQFQAEIAAALLARNSPDTVNQASFRTYADSDPEAVHRQYRDRSQVTDSSVWIDGDQLSRCCQLLPFISKLVPSRTDQLPPLTISNGGLTIPHAIFRLKLAEYAWHGWARLVHTAYNTLDTRDRNQLVADTPHAEDVIYDRFRTNNPVYTPYYASESDNPQREWQRDTYTKKPLQIEDKRLITVVDCIRASPTLSFGEPLPVKTLFTHLKTYFPPPRRPGNDIHSRNTLIKALTNAESHQIILSQNEDASQLLCKIPAPPATPIYPCNDDGPNIWDSYLRLQANFQRSSVESEWIRDSDGHRQVIPPKVPEQTWQATSTDYDQALRHAHRTAAQTQATVSSIHDIHPLVDPESVELTRDELVFLTRIGLAMERKIADFSLTDSMRPLRQQADGTTLDVNEDKLKDHDWLERHDEGLSVLYTVPADKRKLLGIENTSNDGYGETTTSEKSLHRKGIDQTAVWLATKSDVTRVVRYYDLWRLRSTTCEQQLRNRDLLSKRIDVIAFNDTTPKYIAEVETASNSQPRTRRCIQKLAAFSEFNDIETTLVTPNPEHLWTLMQHLDHPSYFDFNSFPDANSEDYSPSTWETKLENEGVIGQFLDQLKTYRSLSRSSVDPEQTRYQDKIVGNI